MPELKKDSERPGTWVWTKPGLDRSKYTRVMLEPIYIFISPDSKYKGLNTNDLYALAFRFHEAFKNSLEPEVPMIETKGEGVLFLRIALTNVKLVKKKRGLLGYTPVGFVATTAAEVAGKRISLKDAMLQVEVLDSVTGERIGVLLDEAPKALSEQLSWESISKTLTFYAERYKKRLHSKN